MTVNRLSSLTALAVVALVTAACGSIGLPDILGGDSDRDDRRTGGDFVTVRGVIEDVDTRSRLIVVDGDVDYNLRNTGGGDRLTLYYDSDTTVIFEGRTYDPADLERGDRIVADVDDTGSRLLADRIEVTYDVTGGVGGSVVDDERFAELRGTVRSIDASARTLLLERASYTSGFTTNPGGGGDVVTVHWDAETVVEYEGRFYGPESLERGDVVDVEVTDTGSRLLAGQIEVVRDVRAGS